LVDADRDPRCKSLPPPGSHRSFPPKRCISVVRHDALYCIAMLHVKRYFDDIASNWSIACFDCLLFDNCDKDQLVDRHS
jgi:hypothetical protein